MYTTMGYTIKGHANATQSLDKSFLWRIDLYGIYSEMIIGIEMLQGRYLVSLSILAINNQMVILSAIDPRNLSKSGLILQNFFLHSA